MQRGGRLNCRLEKRIRQVESISALADGSRRAGWAEGGLLPIGKTPRSLRWDELGTASQTVQRCVERAVAEGPMTALDDRPRRGREHTITLRPSMAGVAGVRKARTWLSHELWTTRLLARHAREHGPAEGHAGLATWRKARCARSSTKRR